MPQKIEKFGETPDGCPIQRVTLKGGGLQAKLLTYGASLQDLRLTGFAHPLVLGAPSIEPYFGPMKYFGALVGRFANRIGHGRFLLDGHDYRLVRNWLGQHTLHGGEVGADEKIWSIEKLTGNSVTMGLELPDGDMGFPGQLTIHAEITLTEDYSLSFDIRATTTAATPCSFAHHSYFNLDGGPDITRHDLRIDAEAYLPVDADLIPTGEIRPVDGTKFDFRARSEIGTRGLDHNFCLSDTRKPLRPVARLRSTENDLSMSVETTETGLQVYDSAYIPEAGLVGLDGKKYKPFAGIALETQVWPDAPNRSEFPDAVLRPGNEYRHQVRYVFMNGSPQ
ncbi:aldose epimerase family protein [Mameliella sp.]|uniref:aldose epimerase family protein n=1 Tax=Mameliella sp. TaxID=1924940 RepID=UPI003BAACBB4